MATLTFEENKFVFRGTADERFPAKDAGFVFHSAGWADPHWSTGYIDKVQDMIENCKKLKVGLKIEDSAKEEVRRIEALEREKLGLSRGTDADLDIPVPKGLSYYNFQKAGIEYALKLDNVLIADEMGLGKTIQAIGVINHEKPRKILAVVPASLKLNWKREFERWLVDNYSISIIGSKPDYEADIIIINYERLRSQMKQFLSLVEVDKETKDRVCTVCGVRFKTDNYAYNHIDNKHPDKIEDKILTNEYDLLILDESQYVKNYKAQRTQSVIRIAKRAKKRIFLTGTPILNRPIELFTPLSVLRSEIVKKGWQHFVTHYCAGYRGRFGWHTGGASNLEELNKKLRTSVMVRRLKKDVLTELPAKIHSIIPIEAEGRDIQIALAEEKKQKDKWELVKAELAVMKEDNGEVSDEDRKKNFEAQVSNLRREVMLAFTEIARVRHQTALAKLPEAIGFIRNILEIQDKVVVFTHHRDVLDKIYREFEDISVKMMGGMDIKERDKSVKRFQEDKKIRLFLGTTQSAGLGITLTAGSTVIFIELEWTPSEMNQAEDRLHRIGQEDVVNVYHLVVDGSIDADLSNVLIDKQKVITKALDKEIEVEELELSDIEAPETEKSSRRKGLEKIADQLSDEDKERVHRLLRALAGDCDGARKEDTIGFNKIDTGLGKSLAEQSRLSRLQTALGYIIVKKYSRQIGELEDYKKLYNKEAK